MKDSYDGISKTREKEENEDEKLLNGYITKIRERYEKYSNEEKANMLEGLENLLENPIIKKEIDIDSNKARIIRQREKLTQKELGSIIGVNQSLLHAYENGLIRNPEGNKRFKKYANWLISHGYRG